MASVGFMVIYWIAPAENCSSLFLKKKNLFYDFVDDLRKKGEKSWWFKSLPGILLWNFSRQIWSSRFASTWPSQRGIKGTMIRSKNLENPLAFLVMHYLQCLHYLHCITMYYLYYLHNMHQLYHLWVVTWTMYLIHWKSEHILLSWDQEMIAHLKNKQIVHTKGWKG